MDVSQHYLLQNIFRSYADVLARQRLPLHQLKAIDAITACRSGELGTSYYQCADGHGVHQQHHSCRHRSCYLCSRGSQRRWIDSQKKRLLDCPHFHVVFTLPSEYRVLWQYNTAWFTRALFTAVQETLLTLMGDHHGVTPGVLLTLHTWGRRLNLHPHIHGLVTAGGLDKQRQWQATGDYLLPAAALKSLYRGKLQALIKAAYIAGDLQLPPDMTTGDFLRLHRSTYRKRWAVRVQEQYRHGRGVVLYLSRYMKGGPLHPAQIQQCNADRIAIRYRDYRSKRSRLLSLTPLDFIRHLLLHVPAAGAHTVRHYGLYAAACRDKRNHCRGEMNDLSQIEVPAGECEKDMVVLRCSTCGGPMRIGYRSGRKRARKGNSLISIGVSPVVQQDDESGHANAPCSRDPCYSTG